MKKITNNDFIKKANIIHNNKYDYKYTEYINTTTKIKIICRKHGLFEQNPHSHLKGINGCKLCDNERKKIIQTKTEIQFIEKCKIIHNNNYDYSLIKYLNSKTKVDIICKKHGMFQQTPDNHINKKTGCPKCKTEYNSKNKKLNSKIFKNKCIKIHGNKYDYSKSIYLNTKTKVDIICKKHGMFQQTPNNHITKKQGCPKCKNSKGELYIEIFLTKHNIIYETQKIFKNCLSEKNKHLKFDFYLSDYNICIEYDGEQHFKPIKYWGGLKKYKSVIYNDYIKNIFCENNNIELLRIYYFDFDNIENILNKKIIYRL